MKKPMGKKLALIFVLCMIMAVSVAFGCSANKETSASYARDEGYYGYDSYVDEPMEAPMAMEDMDASGMNGSYYTGETQTTAQTSTALSNRKIIRNAEVNVQTLEFEKFIDALNDAVTNAGGFIETSSVGGRTYNSSYRKMRSAYFVIRVPAEHLDAFLNTVDGLGNVTSQSTGLRDVTTNYVDSEKRLEALRTEQEALLEILAKAETVEDIITVQDRLSQVRYEIESYASILRTYDDQIDLSTVTLNLNEVERETVVEPETFGQEVSRRFRDSLSGVGDFFRSLGAFFFGEAPAILVFLVFNGVIVLIIVLSIRGGIKRRAKRRAKKLQEQQAKQQQQ